MRRRQQQSARIGAQPPSPVDTQPLPHAATLGSSRDVGNGPKPPRPDHTRARSVRYQAPQLSRRAVRLGGGPQPSRKTRTQRKKAYGAHPKRRQNQAIGHRVSWRGVRRVRCVRGAWGVRCERCVRGVRVVTLLRGRSGSRGGCEGRLWLLPPCRS